MSKYKKDNIETRDFVTRPALKEKPTKNKVQDIIYKSLESNILKYMDKEKTYDQEKVVALNKIITDEVKNKLKENPEFGKRYKFIVHCMIGEKRGQGIRIGSKFLWDTNTDIAVWSNYDNEILFSFCSVYGVYYY